MEFVETQLFTKQLAQIGIDDESYRAFQTLATVKLALSKYRNAIRAVDPDPLSRPPLRRPTQNPQAPGTSFEPYPIPVLADPMKLIQALDQLRSLKSFLSPEAVNNDHRAPTPQVRFRGLRLPRPTLETRTPPKRLRRHLLPQVQTRKPDRRYLPRQILGHKLLGPNASLSVGQSYQDFYIR
jgi:hypothetical protein